ncbi:hypothetical protein H0H87_011570 [Tephrocybe sp. NHM501043]|nr:hypothetical protein H0H87_011570 [Tephrocybe sp. NHM501043]
MVHYIRTIHTDFTSRGAPSSPTVLMASSSPDWRSPSPSAAHTPYTRRTRRAPAVPYRPPHSPNATRAAPPPPRISYDHVKFDPFFDDLIPSDEAVLYRTPRTTPASISASSVPQSQGVSSFTLRTPHQRQAQQQQQQQPFDPNARSRLVAGILLNRVHAVGRPMRRRGFDQPREYVKSRLSSVVSVEA